MFFVLNTVKLKMTGYLRYEDLTAPYSKGDNTCRLFGDDKGTDEVIIVHDDDVNEDNANDDDDSDNTDKFIVLSRSGSTVAVRATRDKWAA